ncbi:MAG TPA: sigma-70 region 4 domain-containing protein, partial [Polyangiaceae bacterium]|nr:sigma-70 region 4 domain-containing protein [Polyangiaceae bacterium]
VEPRWMTIDAALVRRCLEDLDPRLRDAYLLRSEQHLPLADVATQLGVAPSTAGTRVFRARRKLRQMLSGAVA